MRGDHVRQSSEDREGDHDRHQLVIALKVRVGARTPGAGRLHGRQERPPLPHDGPCLGQPDLRFKGEHDSDVTLQRHDKNRKKGRY